MKRSLVFILSAVSLVFPGVSFIQAPRLTGDAGSGYYAEFALSDSADITVAILNLRDGSIVRHLAAGVLGANAPAPLAPSSLTQRIRWDGKDDLGRTPTADSLGVRVRAGMSVKLANLIGGNPYHFTSNSGGYPIGYAPNISGIIQDKNGNMYICGSPGPVYHHHTFKNYKVIRKYGPDGKFIKTVFPFASNLDQTMAGSWGINIFNGGFAPKQTITSFPGFTNTILCLEKDPEGILMMIDSSGTLVYGSADQIIKLDTLGYVLNGGVSSKLIATPARRSILGSTFFTLLPNRKEALLSGFFYATQTNGHLVDAPADSFYSDGKVFKVNLTTGVTTQWLSLDSVPRLVADRTLPLGGGEFIAAIHGTATDNSGRVYVADRLHKQIGVYDTNGLFLSRIPVACADNITISARSGAVYVATRYQPKGAPGHIRLFKFSAWPQFQPVCSLTVETSVASGNVNEPVWLSANDAMPETRIWFGYDLSSIKIFQDNGDQLAKIIDFKDTTANIHHGYDRLAVDQRSGALYINDGWFGIFKIEDWANPLVVPCTTSTRQRLYGRDMQVSASNLLYVSSGINYTGPITRYTLDHLHAPANWPNTGKNMLVSSTPQRATGDRGFAVRSDGRVAVMGIYSGNTSCGVKIYSDSGANDTTGGKVMLYPMPNRSGCVRYDFQGNLYVGARTAGVPVPPEFTGDWAFGSSVGAVVKYDKATDTGSITTLAAPNAAKVYPYPLSPYSTDKGAACCICRNPRFDVDGYGRLLIPSSVMNQVIVADNAGNEILRFGKYGNPDSWGGLPQAWPTIATPEIPLAFPTAVTAGEDHLFVTDFANCRLARLKINYALDNMPGLISFQEGSALAAPRQTALKSSPVPFASSTRISVSLATSEKMNLRVYGLDGRLVKTLADGSLAVGTHGFIWNGTDEKGNRLASGVYFYRLTTRGGALVSRTFLNR